MKPTFFLFLLACSFSTFCQLNFEQVITHNENPFRDAFAGSCAVGDIDGDGDLDIFLQGWDDPELFAHFYINDGTGHFTKDINNNFPGQKYCSSKLFDFDGDGDNDLIVSGDYGWNSETRIYENDGNGVFFINPQILDGFQAPSISIGDINNDGFNDILIGDHYFGTKVYLYNGNFGYTISSFDLSNINGSNLLTDIDNDNDLDIVISGQNGINPTLFFKNDGQGNFTPFSQTIPIPAIAENYSWARKSLISRDFDNDGDVDLLLNGYQLDTSSFSTALYKNDGNGQYTLFDTSFNNQLYSTLISFDIDNDSDLDLIFSGLGGPYTGNCLDEKSGPSVYLNNGNGSFLYSVHHIFDNFFFSDMAHGDFNADGFMDMFVTGRDNNYSVGQENGSSYVLKNMGNSKFKCEQHSVFLNTPNALHLYDFDGDQDLDLITESSINCKKYNFYRNNGFGTFERDGLNIPDNFGGIRIFDFDGDGDPDLLFERDQTSPNTNNGLRLYENDGTGSFSINSSTFFSQISYGSTYIYDFDGDGDQDVFVSGYDTLNAQIFASYDNLGNGIFNQIPHNIPDTSRINQFMFGDFNGDQNLDLYISFTDSLYQNQESRILINNGNMNFSENLYQPNSYVQQLSIRSSLVFDPDNDGDQDILLSGLVVPGGLFTTILENDGSGDFGTFIQCNLPNAVFSNLSSGDFDQDGFPDMVFSGQGFSNTSESGVFRNNGLGVFINESPLGYPLFRRGPSAIGDVDGDGDLDFFVSGPTENDSEMQLYINQQFLNSPKTPNAEAEILIYPNPNNGIVNIQYPKWKNEKINIEIFSIEGKQVFYQTINFSEFTTLNIGQLKPGIHLIRVQNETESITKKLVIK